MAVPSVDPRPRGRPWVPWDWTDVVLFLVLVVASVVAVSAPIVLGAQAAAPLLHISRQTAAEVVGQAAVDLPAVGIVVLLVFLRRHGDRRQLGWRLPRWWWFLLAFPLALLCLLISVPLQTVNEHLTPGHTNGQCQAVKQGYGAAYALALPMLSGIVPFAEETVFRGFFFGWLRRVVPLWLAVLLAALVFAAVHFTLVIFIPLFAVGLVLVLTYQLSGSLYPGMLVHALFNLVGVISILTASSCSA
ncbi:MAG: lysostaphin resistance A-like protein [Candidatus Dormibacteria bacterium]